MKSPLEQAQFLDVVDRDQAERAWRAAFPISSEHCGNERVPLEDALGRVLAEDVMADVDVPFFDRSNLDGFAVRAEDTFGAEEERPRVLRILPEVIATAVVPRGEVGPGEAMAIATGGMLPRGADAIVMVEHTRVEGDSVFVHKSVTPGRGLTFAGTDIAKGETVYRQGDVLTSRETGVLAAIGVSMVSVRKRPRVAILSTGDEIIPPGQPMRPGLVYDSNAQVLADAVRELGAEPERYGVVADDLDALHQVVERAIAECDVVLLSGGTSKGAGDISYEVVRQWQDPGIVAHGVALKPGKPICLAATRGKPVVVLPGFPTSAIFTFHEFVAAVILEMGGRPRELPARRRAEMALPVSSEIGRTEFLLVGLVRQPNGASAAYPMGKGSGSVTAFARADGFVRIERHQEILEAGADVEVTLLGRDLAMADLVMIGSHCLGVDYLLGELQRQGIRTKFLAVGSTAGLAAISRGECDIAGMHLWHPEQQAYNRPYLKAGLSLVPGYVRQQGLLYRPDDKRFAARDLDAVVERIRADDCVMVNRNQGSGTRVVIDELLDGDQPAGYATCAHSHRAVAASIAQHRSDWGIAIEAAARQNGLGFLPLRAEEYDFVIRSGPRASAVEHFCELLEREDTRQALARLGLEVS